MTQKKLTRSINNRKIAGVCGGLGEYFNIDPLIFRIIFLFLLLGGGTGFILYVLLWILVPDNNIYNNYNNKNETQHATFQDSDVVETINHSINNNFMKKKSGIFWGVLLVALGLLWLGKSFGLFHFHWYNALKLWPLLIIWLGITLLPIERIWKNICSFVIIAIAIVLLFVLPVSSCRHHFWEDDFRYEIRKIFRNTECNIYEETKNNLTQKEILITEKIKGVIIEGPWEVIINQNDTSNSASIEYDVSDSKITTQFRSNGYLHIKVSGNNFRKKTLNATINAAQLENIEVKGAATIKTYGQFNASPFISLSGASELTGFLCDGENAKIILSGASSMKNSSFKGKNLDAKLSGASELIIHDMQVERCKVNISGASDFKGDGNAYDLIFSSSGASSLKTFDLESENLNIDLSGASSAEVTVNQTIKGTLTGASTLRYKKAEDVRNVSKNGGSRIINVK
jgi:phage shock protein PspC (stress-responsive transcriptional regulator)